MEAPLHGHDLAALDRADMEKIGERRRRRGRRALAEDVFDTEVGDDGAGLNRARILAQTVAASTVVLAKDVLAMGKDESRALIRDHDVVYVYHNLVDKTGDTRDTEERAFGAAEETLVLFMELFQEDAL